MRLKGVPKLLQGHPEGRTFFAFVIGIEEKNTRKMSSRRDKSRHRGDVVGTRFQGDGAVTGVLEDEIIRAIPVEKVFALPIDAEVGIAS